MPFIKEGNIHHRNTLKELVRKLKGKKDVLIIIDEVHIASSLKGNQGKGQSINQLLGELGYKDLSNLRENNINCVVFSATPQAVLDDHIKWKEEGKAKIYKMEPGEGYKGPKELINGRAFQYEKLNT